ncbi:hypothetical protein HYH02_015550, partial [Chlamydomonas schloesseri]
LRPLSAALPSPARAPAPPPVWRSFYKGSVDCFKQVLSKYGVKGLYRGFTSTVLRDMQVSRGRRRGRHAGRHEGTGEATAWFFMGYEATVNYFLQNAGPGVHTKADLNYMQVMGAGVMAGFGLWLHADNLAKPQYSSTMDCVRKVLASEGQAGLWRGFSAAMYRAIPVNAGIFLAVEGARQSIKYYEENVEHIYGGVVGTV